MMTRIETQRHQYYEMIYTAVKEDDHKKFRELFLKLHLKDQEELFQLLYPKNKKKIEQFLTPIEFAEVFEWMNPEEQMEVYEVFSPSYIADFFPYMETDNVVKFLSLFSQDDVHKLLEHVNPSERKKIEEMLAYKPETAGSIMTKGYIAVSPEDTIEQVSESVRSVACKIEVVYYIYVVDTDGNLVGVASLRDLFLHPMDTQIASIMQTQFVFSNKGDDQEVAGRLLQGYNFFAIPVLNETGKMLGIITVDDIMDIMDNEVTEDFNEFSAISNTKAKEEGVWEVTRARMPWIIILIFLGMISTSLISSFEETLNQVVLIAAFIPIIMDSAGNVGTQSLAVAVRKISMGEDVTRKGILRTLWQEFLVGMLLGGAAGMVLALIVAVFFGNTLLGIVIGVSLFITLSFSTVSGAIIPIFIHKLNIDPAVASGPFITTVNDAVGLMVYFTIASQLIHLI